MKAKDNRRRAADQIKILAAYKAAPAIYDRGTRAKVPCKKESSTGVIPYRKQYCKKKPNHKGSKN